MGKMKPADKESTVCGCIIKLLDSGLAKDIQTIKIGGILEQNI